jgi:hypothetical protein
MPLFAQVTDQDGHETRISGKTDLRLRVQTRPGSVLSMVITETGEWRLGEQLDSSRKARVRAKGKLPSGVVSTERWNSR